MYFSQFGHKCERTNSALPARRGGAFSPSVVRAPNFNGRSRRGVNCPSWDNNCQHIWHTVTPGRLSLSLFTFLSPSLPLISPLSLSLTLWKRWGQGMVNWSCMGHTMTIPTDIRPPPPPNLSPNGELAADRQYAGIWGESDPWERDVST